MPEEGDVTIWLQIELDVNIYPELHEAIDRASEPEKQAERLRQLAATGLLWEALRISGGTRDAPSTAKLKKTPSGPQTPHKPRTPPADPFIPTLFDVVEAAAVAASKSEPPSSEAEAAPNDAKAPHPARGSNTPRNSSRLQKMRARGFFALD